MAPFKPSNHLIFLTNRLARLLASEIRGGFTGEYRDLNGSAIGLLADLWTQDGVSVEDLGTARIKSRSSMRQLIKMLSSKDLIRVEEGTALIYLTPTGSALQGMVEQASARLEADYLPGVTAEDVATTKRVLHTLYHNLQSPTSII